jgi:hypothetical protein
MANVESSVAQLRHFIEQAYRPDLSKGALAREPDVTQPKAGEEPEKQTPSQEKKDK